MNSQLPEYVFRVVVFHDAADNSETTWPSAYQADRHVQSLLDEGISQDSIRVYRARVVRPSFGASWR